MAQQPDPRPAPLHRKVQLEQPFLAQALVIRDRRASRAVVFAGAGTGLVGRLSELARACLARTPGARLGLAPPRLARASLLASLPVLGPGLSRSGRDAGFASADRRKYREPQSRCTSA